MERGGGDLVGSEPLCLRVAWLRARRGLPRIGRMCLGPPANAGGCRKIAPRGARIVQALPDGVRAARRSSRVRDKMFGGDCGWPEGLCLRVAWLRARRGLPRIGRMCLGPAANAAGCRKIGPRGARIVLSAADDVRAARRSLRGLGKKLLGYRRVESYLALKPFRSSASIMRKPASEGWTPSVVRPAAGARPSVPARAEW